MPLRAFLHPQTGEAVDFTAAPAVFETEGLLPAEVTAALIEQESRSHEEHSLVSPSKLSPDTICRREQVIRHFLPYDTNPLVFWDAMEGTLWHQTLVAAGDKVDGYYRELSLPRPEDATHPAVKQVEGVLAVEVWPGIYMRGTVDRLREDLVEMIDHKTQRFPQTAKGGAPTDFADPDPKGRWKGNRWEWEPQINAYRFIVETLMGTAPTELWVWRTYRGSRSREHTFRKVPVGVLTRDQLWARVGEFVTDLTARLGEAVAVRDSTLARGEDPTPALEALVRATPMDGYEKRIFNGQKCDHYCACKAKCWELAGMLTW